jgi:hypothetical protein
MARTPKQKKPAGGSPGVVNVNELYRMDELLGRLGLGEDGWRALRRRGLEQSVVRIGGRSYISGADVVAFFRAIRNANSTSTDVPDDANAPRA